MSDTENKPLLPYGVARSFKPKDAFGNPKKVLNAMPKDGEGNPVDGTMAVMGVVFGRAESVYLSERKDQHGEVKERYFGLKGTFESIPEDRTINPNRTGVAWLIEHIHADIASRLQNNDPVTGEVNEDGGLAVDFAYSISIKANKKVSTGFTWEYVPMVDMDQQSDPLRALRASAAKALTAPLPPHLLAAPVKAKADAHDGDPAVAAMLDADEAPVPEPDEAPVPVPEAHKGGRKGK